MAAPPVPDIAAGNQQFSSDMRAFHAWEAGELWAAVEAFFNGRLISTTGTSTSSVLIGTGDKTFTTQSGLGFVTGMPVNVVSTANPANYMSGFVKSYSSTTLVVTVITTGGSGTLAAWSIALGLSGGGASLGVNTFLGTQTFAAGANVASAATVNLSALTDGNFRALIGTTNINAWTVTNGAMHKLVYTGAGLTLTHNASTNNINGGGANVSLSTGDRLLVTSIGGVVYVEVLKADGKNVVNLSNTVSQLNSSVTVTDTGADGKITKTVDGVIVSEETASSRKSTIDGGTTLLPEFKCRAWVNFDGSTSGTFAGGASTVTRIAASTTATVTTTTPHGLSTGNTVRALTGVVAGNYVITVTSATTFTFTTVATTALTAVAITFDFANIRGSGNVNSVAILAGAQYFVNLSTPMPDANYAALASSNPVLAASYIVTAGIAPYNGATYSLTEAGFGVATGGGTDLSVVTCIVIR